MFRSIYEGYDGKKCLVHARSAANGAEVMMTAQMLDVTGSDSFDCLQINWSHDGGNTWTGFEPIRGFEPFYTDGLRHVACDMTPMFHKKSGRFIVTGGMATYIGDSNHPAPNEIRKSRIPYAVYDEEKGAFGGVKVLEMPDDDNYHSCNSGCSQCLELENGEILVPFSLNRYEDGKLINSKAAVARCAFDGETITVLEVGGELEVADEVRGIGECSVVLHEGRYYLTIRGDTYGYISVSEDGLNYTKPQIWHWSNGTILPTYNTQSHWMQCGGKLYLVYTRRDGKNDHVFRNRAPLYAAEVDTETVTVRPETEFVVAPERGARLGNFGVCAVDGNVSLVTAAEWMQPAGCEKFGSNNAIWLTEVCRP